MSLFEVYNDELKFVDGTVTNLTTHHQLGGFTLYKTHDKIANGHILKILFLNNMVLISGHRKLMEKVFPFLIKG